MTYFNNISEIEGLISRLIDKLDASRTESVELDVGDVRIRLNRHGELPVSSPIREPVHTEIPKEPAVKPVSAESPSAEAAVVKSPLLGTAYAAPSPDAAPFVTVGQKVKKGEIICIIEAMKVMNEIEADHDGVVTEILFENGKLVEFGQPLIALK